VPVDQNAPQREFEKIAHAFPVFQIVSRRLVQPSRRSEAIGTPAVAAERRSPLAFFVLTYALAVPFWLLGAVTGGELLPGLPVAALMTGCPLIAAAILVYRVHKRAGVRALFQRSFDFPPIPTAAWYGPILLLMPTVALVSFGVLRLGGVAIPAPQIGLGCFSSAR